MVWSSAENLSARSVLACRKPRSLFNCSESYGRDGVRWSHILFFLCVLCRSAPKHLFWFVLLTRVFVSPSFSSVAACSNSCSLSCSNSASHWLIAPALVSHWLTVSNSSPSTRTESVRSKPETHIDKSAFSICTNTTHTNCDAKRHWCGWD